ncbi:hypothetical protein Tco_0590709 [Tanacetum coccineum]
MFAAIKARFGENEATKRTQKALLKQQYENFNASSSESLDSIFYRLQKLVSKLAILGVVTSPEDLNVKFLRGLPSEWDTHVVVWMNKPDFDTIGLDDLYNNFKIVEQKVKKSTADNNDDKNLAFLTTSSPSSTNTINTVNTRVSTGTTKVNTASTETSTASFSDATVYAFLSTQPQGSELVHEDLEQLHDDDLEEMDLKWNMALLSMRARKFYQRTGRKIIIDGSNGVGFDWSDMAEDEIQANMALMTFTDSEVSNDKSCSKSCLQNYEALKKQKKELKSRKNNDAPIIEIWVSDVEEEVEPIPKVERKTAIPTATKKESVKPEKPIRRSLSFPNAHKHMVPRAVLMKTGLKTVNNTRPVNIVRPFYKKTAALTKRSNNQNINTGRQTVNTGRQNVNTVRARGFNVSNSQLNDKGFVDSGCSRHMSGNIAHLSDFKDFDGGYVTFGGGANGGRITGKCTIKTDKLDFEDVYFVKELKFNPFSISQMCDKKNYVLFTDSECLVLSPNFKLPDENQILLKIPRQNNIIQGVSESSTSSQQVKIVLSCQFGRMLHILMMLHSNLLLMHKYKIKMGLMMIAVFSINVNTPTPEDLMGPIPTSEGTQVEDQEIELGNISPSYAVSSTPHTRIHKDHPIDHVIGDVQTFIHVFLLVSYLKKNKRVLELLRFCMGRAMQEELLQFKLQNVWVSCIDLVTVIGFWSSGSTATRKMKVGTSHQDNARLVAKDLIKKERHDYDEVLLQWRIERNKNILAYAFIGFYSVPNGCQRVFPLYGQMKRRL